MPITPIHAIAIIVIAGTITFGSRVLPFLFFKNGKVPKTILYLGNVLPASMMALLIVYSLKDTKIMQAPYGLYEAIGLLTVIILHHWKQNSLISIFGGTLLYMFLVQM